MTVLLVVAALLAVLAVACWREARSGRPMWGSHLERGETLTTAAAAKSAKKGVATTVALGAFMGMDGDG